MASSILSNTMINSTIITSTFLLSPHVDFSPPVNQRGSEWWELYHAVPALEPLYMEWEKTYDPEPVVNWMQSVPWLPFVAVLLYVVGIFGGQEMMKGYKRFDLRMPLAYWNLLLAVFSFAGMMRVVPHFFYLIYTQGFHVVACGAPEPLYGNGSVGFWVQAFCLSKLAELIDTVLIVLRKRDLMFLHWYHHVTVLLFTWFSYTMENPGIIFVAMNYSVHAVMYGYYYLMAVKAKPAWLNPQIITVMQILQMVVGVSVAIYYYFVLSSGSGSGARASECAVKPQLLYACGIMYSTYLYLFAEFFVKRFILKKAKTA